MNLVESANNRGQIAYHRQWNTPTNPPKNPIFTTPGSVAQPQGDFNRLIPTPNKHEDDAKLLFGVIYSLRNMTRKLGTQLDFPLKPELTVFQRRQLCFVPYVKV